jgi:hypothetical protein
MRHSADSVPRGGPDEREQHNVTGGYGTRISRRDVERS